MTEAQFQAKLLKKLRAHSALRECAVIFKHSDRFNSGIPDVSVTINDHRLRTTTWFELKVGKNKTSKIQQYYLQKLGRAYEVRLQGFTIEIVDSQRRQVVTSFDEAVQYIVELCFLPEELKAGGKK